MSRGSKSAEKQPYSRKDGPAQQQRANDDDAGGEKNKRNQIENEINKIAFSFHSSWTHPNLFRRPNGRPIFSHDKSAVERNGQSVEDDAEESGAERWADYARVGWPASTCIKLSRHAPFSSSFPFRRSRDDGRDYTSWKGAVLQTYRLSLKVRSQTS